MCVCVRAPVCLINGFLILYIGVNSITFARLEYETVSPSCLADGNEFSMQEGLSRLPLKMDTPEKILCQAHAQARPLADFLHENGKPFTYELLQMIFPSFFSSLLAYCSVVHIDMNTWHN